MVDLPEVNVWHESGGVWQLDGHIRGYTTLECETAFRTQGTWSMTVPNGAPYVERVNGTALITVDWNGARWATGRLTQPVTKSDSRGRISLEFAGETGLTVFQGVNCWPDPTRDLNTQPRYGLYEGLAETVVLSLVMDFYRDHYGQQIVSAVSQGQGSTVRVRSQWNDLLPLIVKAARRGGMAVDVGLVDTSGTRAELTLTQWVPEDRSHVAILSPQVGSLRGWQYGQTRPVITRALVGGANDDDGKRVFRRVTTSESDAAAAAWGGHVEDFVDAPGIIDPVELDEIGVAAIEDGLAGDTFQLEASQAPGMRVWETARLGDLIAVQLATGVSTVEPLRGLRLTVAKDTGITVTPIVGDPDGTTPAQQYARLVRRARRRIRNLEASRDTLMETP